MKPGAGRQQGSPDREVLAGPVERVTFHNPENGFCVLRTRARGHRERVTVVGHAATVSPAEWVEPQAGRIRDPLHAAKHFRLGPKLIVQINLHCNPPAARSKRICLPIFHFRKFLMNE